MIGRSSWFRVPLSLAIVAGITEICFRLFDVNATTAGFAYLLAILLIAAAWGLIEALVASLTGVVCFNYFFLPPIGRFGISDPENWVALFAFLATALVASHLSHRARKQTEEAQRRHQETERLYEFSRAILLTGTAGPIGFHVAQNLARIFDFPAVALHDPGTGQVFLGGQSGLPEMETILRGEVAGGESPLQLESDVLVTTITSGSRPLGTLALKGPALSDSAFQALLKLVAIAKNRSRNGTRAGAPKAGSSNRPCWTPLRTNLRLAYRSSGLTAVLTDVPDLPAQVELTTIIDEEAAT